MNQLFFANLLPGTLLFNRYRLERCLSASDIGGVYLCSCILDPTHPLVIKVVSTRALYGSDIAANFTREASIVQNLSHPNVVKGYQFHQDEDFTAFTMEYIRGSTLDAAFPRTRNSSILKVLRVMRQVCFGVEGIHAVGVVHRDLKPENVLIKESGQVKIIDFGISSYCSAETRGVDRITGTINYLCPESVGGGAIDHRSDIYSLGIMCYEFLTGKLPFEGASLIESLSMRVRFDPTPPHELRPDCPRALSAITMRAMAREPDKRFQSAPELGQALQAVNKSMQETLRDFGDARLVA